jgi:hypothetical protein
LIEAERVESLPSQLQENLVESLVSRPERDVSHQGGQQQMNVNISETFPHQAVILNELEGLFLIRLDCTWQFVQQREYGRSVLEIAAGKFAHDKGVTEDFSRFQQRVKANGAGSEMLYPD